MKTIVTLCSLVLLISLPIFASPPSEDPPGHSEQTIAIVVHGGAGTLKRSDLSPEKEAAYRAKLTEAIDAGYRLLANGGTSLDAVVETLKILEDSPLFNAGKGAVFTAEGHNELDASIMVGPTRDAGAVAGVTTIKNPITAARAVMERTPHVMLSGPGADRFAAEIGLELEKPSYFFTERRWKALQKRIEKEKQQAAKTSTLELNQSAEIYRGTVGAVALDRFGHLTAGTSTGGMTYKKHGRVGDSPIIGAGTYADKDCGISATGHGELFIRHAVAHDICARMAYGGKSIEEAAREVIHEVLAPGDGGIIALDGEGTVVMSFNTTGMYRGFRKGGDAVISIYGDSTE